MASLMPFVFIQVEQAPVNCWGSSLTLDSSCTAHISYVADGKLKYSKQKPNPQQLDTVLIDEGISNYGKTSIETDFHQTPAIGYLHDGEQLLKYAFLNLQGDWEIEKVDELPVGGYGYCSLAFDQENFPYIAVTQTRTVNGSIQGELTLYRRSRVKWKREVTVDSAVGKRFLYCNLEFDKNNHACISYAMEDIRSSAIKYADYRKPDLLVQPVASFTNGFACSPSLALYNNKSYPAIAYLYQTTGSSACNVFFSYPRISTWHHVLIDSITNPAALVCSLALDGSHPAIVYAKPPVATGEVRHVAAVSGSNWARTTLFSRPNLRNVNTYVIESKHGTQALTYSIEASNSESSLWLAYKK
jgi:hypothetical protein